MKQIFTLILLLVIGYAVYEVLQEPKEGPEPPAPVASEETEPPTPVASQETEPPAPVPSINPLDQLKKTNRCPDCNLEKADLQGWKLKGADLNGKVTMWLGKKIVFDIEPALQVQ